MPLRAGKGLPKAQDETAKDSQGDHAQNPVPIKTRRTDDHGAQARSGHAYQVMTHKYIKPWWRDQRLRAAKLLVPTCCGTGSEYLDLADGVYLSGAGPAILPHGQENSPRRSPVDRDRGSVRYPQVSAALDLACRSSGSAAA